MSSAFAESDALERGTNGSQVQPVIAEAVAPDIDEGDNSIDWNDQGSNTTASPTDEDDLDPGQ